MSEELKAALRESIAEANTAAPEASDLGGSVADEVAVVPDAGQPETVGAAVDGADAGAVGGDAAAKPAAGERPRGPDGKFAPKPAQPKTPEVVVKPTVGAQPTAVKPTLPATPAETFKAPQSWSPVAREHFGKAPPEVQREVAKREKEIATAMQESAGARKHFDEFRQLTAPYAPILGHDPAQALKTTAQLYQTVHALQVGTVQQKAALLGGMIKGYGLNSEQGLDLLAQAIQGGPVQQQAQQMDPQALIQQAKAEFQRELDARRQSSTSARAQAEIAKVAEKEFFEDVREDVAIEMERAARKGLTLTLEQAYARALRVHQADEDSEVGKILRQRDAAKAATTAQAATEQRKTAASSVKSQPAAPVAPGPASSIKDELREQLRAARKGQ